VRKNFTHSVRWKKKKNDILSASLFFQGLVDLIGKRVRPFTKCEERKKGGKEIFLITAGGNQGKEEKNGLEKKLEKSVSDRFDDRED